MATLAKMVFGSYADSFLFKPAFFERLHGQQPPRGLQPPAHSLQQTLTVRHTPHKGASKPGLELQS